MFYCSMLPAMLLPGLGNRRRGSVKMRSHDATSSVWEMSAAWSCLLLSIILALKSGARVHTLAPRCICIRMHSMYTYFIYGAANICENSAAQPVPHV